MNPETQELATTIHLDGTLVRPCKYGENAWQKPAGLYSSGSDDPLALNQFQLIEGTDPSYNNLCDLDRGLQTLTHIEQAYVENGIGLRPIALGLKHGNCCGAASLVSVSATFIAMTRGDPRALFGGVVLLNYALNPHHLEDLYSEVPEAKLMLDAVIASRIAPEAVDLLKRKGNKCRFLVNRALSHPRVKLLDPVPRFRYVRGGFLVQPNYQCVPQLQRSNPDLRVYGHEKQQFWPGIISDLLLAWAIGSTSTSNTITLVKGGMLIGNGVGQQDRVGCCELALKRTRDAGHDPRDAVAYSDSFFPFPDGPKALIDAGITAILSTSGSVRDKETISLCEERGVTLYLLPDAEARGFYGH